MKKKFLPLPEAIATLIHDGDSVALEGFTHLIPFAAGHEIIRQQKKHLTLMRMTPDVIYDQMIGMGCADKLVFSWGGNPGVGSLHRFRDAIENGHPHPLEIEEHTHAAMVHAYEAGAANLPFAVMRGYIGVDLPGVNPNIQFIQCPFTREKLAAVRALRPDVAVIHAQCADGEGNVLIEGIIGIQKECAYAAKRVLVTVEEVTPKLTPRTANAVILPAWTIDAVAIAPHGAFPSYAYGHYDRSNAFYQQWDGISRDKSTFYQWMEENVLKTVDQVI